MMARAKSSMGARSVIPVPLTVRAERRAFVTAVRPGRSRDGLCHSDIGMTSRKAELPPRLHPRLRPRQAGATGLAVATHLRPRPSRGEAAIHLHLGRARGEERAEHADGAVV